MPAHIQLCSTTHYVWLCRCVADCIVFICTLSLSLCLCVVPRPACQHAWISFYSTTAEIFESCVWKCLCAPSLLPSYSVCVSFVRVRVLCESYECVCVCVYTVQFRLCLSFYKIMLYTLGTVVTAYDKSGVSAMVCGGWLVRWVKIHHRNGWRLRIPSNRSKRRSVHFAV